MSNERNIRKANERKTNKKSGNIFLMQKKAFNSTLSIILKLNLAIAIFFILSILVSAVGVEINQVALNLSYGGNTTMDSGTLFIDATNDRVGIGTTSLSGALTVYGGSGVNTNLTINTDNSNTAKINLQRAGSTKATLYADGSSGQVGFKADPSYGFQIGFTDNDYEFVRITRPANGNVRLAGGRSGASGLGNNFTIMGGETNDFQAGNLQLRGGDATGTGKNGNIVFQNAEGTVNYMFINDSTGNVGIGTTSPGAPLEIYTSGVGTITNKGLLIRNSNWYGGGIKGIYFNSIKHTDGTETNEAKILVTTQLGGGGQIGLFTSLDSTSGNLLERMTIDKTGNVGIGTTAPDHDLEIGTGTYSEIDAGEAQFTTGSSREYKENIKPVAINGVLDKISEIPVTTYDFRKEYCNSTEDDEKCKNKIGLIAEDFHTIFGRGSDKEISGQEVEMALWLAVQELKTENEQLRARLEELEVKQQVFTCSNAINSAGGCTYN